MKSAAIGMLALLAATNMASAMVADGWSGIEPAVFTPPSEQVHNVPTPGTLAKPAGSSTPTFAPVDHPWGMEAVPVPGLYIYK